MTIKRFLSRRAGLYGTVYTTGALSSTGSAVGTLTGTFTMNGSPGYVGARLQPTTITGAGGTNSTDTDWGAVGDGSTDDTTALRNALTWLGGAAHRILNFGAGKTYIVNAASGACLSMTSKSFFKINLNGSTIKQKNGMSVYFGAFGIDLITCTDAVITTGTIDGNRANRTPAEQEGHPLALHDCDRIAMVDLTCKNTAGSDNIMISGIGTAETDTTKFCTDILLLRVTCDNGYRGGLFFRNVYNAQVLGGSYKNANGTAPEFGIAIEPNAGSGGGSDGVHNILIMGASFSGNRGVNVYASATVPCRRISMLGCTVDAGGVDNSGNNAAGFSWGGGAFDGWVAYNVFQNINTIMRAIINIQGGFVTGDASGLVVEKNGFNTMNAASVEIYVHSASGSGNIIRNNTGFALSDTFVQNDGTATVSGNVTQGSAFTPTPAPLWAV